MEDIAYLFAIASLATLIFEMRCRKEVELELEENRLELRRIRDREVRAGRALERY